MYEDSDLQRIYNKEYFEGRGSEQKWTRRAKFIVEKFQPKKTLDIGCSWGSVSLSFKRKWSRCIWNRWF